MEHKSRSSPKHILARIGFEFSGNYKLGSGRYSKVYKGYYRDGERFLAIKVIDLEQISAEFRHKFLPRELSVWKQLDHKNHVYLYKDFERAGYQFSIMELATDGDMLSYVQSKGPVSEASSRGWMLQLIDALVYIHQKEIAHRDLKLENILLFEGGILKIADYGFCKQSIDLASTFCGSKSYSAPEILRGVTYDTFKADIWSLGVIGYIMLTNTMPFREDVDNMDIVDAQRHRRYRYSSKLGLSFECKSAIDKMMTFDPKHRPNIYQCALLEWFSPSSTSKGNTKRRRPSLSNYASYNSKIG
ncbi:unnamed protein product [Meloidogyne enterolobii]|uniref:Uncharacterized protein n=1 Tax=Meloidogyne enterolobii TaxID=390850 RepID=A0ACB0YT16_MELEN